MKPIRPKALYRPTGWLIMANMERIGEHKTTVLNKDNSIEVYYHDTMVVSVSGKYLTLNNGGYYTATTKTRMNQTSNQYDLGYRVFQKNFDWFVDFEGETIPFHHLGIITLKKGQGKQKQNIHYRTNNPSY